MRPWDRKFQAWIDEARAQGRDPNDVGDDRWGDPRSSVDNNYLPLFGSDAVVLELGPGSGRYTRHLMPHCKEMILVDYSEFVCDWVRTYFEGKGKFRVVHATDYALSEIANTSIDAIIANGVFEHLDLEGFYQYFTTFSRIMKPGAKGCFDFDNIMSPGGLAFFVRQLPDGMGKRSIFRFHHPETVRRLCAACGLRVEKMRTSEHRFAFLTYKKP